MIEERKKLIIDLRGKTLSTNESDYVIKNNAKQQNDKNMKKCRI